MELPIESKCRRPDWTPGERVTLADGGVWHLPEITTGPLSPTIGSRLNLYEYEHYVHGRPNFELTESLAWTRDLMDAMNDCEMPKPDTDHVYNFILLNVGAALLRANYTVTNIEARILLRYAFEATGNLTSYALVSTAISHVCFDTKPSKHLNAIPINPRFN